MDIKGCSLLNFKSAKNGSLLIFNWQWKIVYLINYYFYGNNYSTMNQEYFRKKELIMIYFLLGLEIGVVIGIALVAIFRASARADENIESIMNQLKYSFEDKENKVISKY
jgi:hypothetical protein